MINTDVKISGGGYVAEFRSDLGGNCYRLCHEASGAELLRTPENEEELFKSIFLYGNAILFPPNRIRGGEFEFEGRRYRFPVNEKRTGCHLHGELYKMPFKVSELCCDRVVFEFVANAGEYLSFPHAFSVKRSYELGEGGLCETVEVTNLSEENMPFMLAFHTTFNAPFMPGSKTENCYMKVGVGCEHLRDGNYLPTLEYVGDRERERALSSGDYNVASGALSAFYNATSATSYVIDRSRGTAISYSASDEYGYRMLWVKEGGAFAVIEPQTCAIDCFHLEEPAEKKGIISIAPGGCVKLSTEFSLIGAEDIKPNF